MLCFYSLKHWTMEREEYRVPPLRTEELKRLSIFEVREILESSLWTNEKIRATVRSTSQNLEELKYFFQIIMKVLQNKRNSEDPNVITLIPVLASSNFEKNLHYLLQCGGRESVLPSIKSVVFFLQELCKRSPSNGNGFLELAVETDKKINDIIGDGDEDVDGLLDLKDDLEDINQIIVNRLAISEVKIEKQKKDTRKPPNNFRNIPILPTLDDLQTKPFFRPNLRDTPFENLDDYLDIQFRLLREDCISQLRNGIFEYIHTKYVERSEARRIQDVRLYKHVTIEEGREMTLDGPMYTIKLDMNQVKRTRWEGGKRMLYGSLLCLIPDSYRRLYFGIIAESDTDAIKKDGRLKIVVKRQKGDPELTKGLKLTLIESVAYFEAYRHVLHCLQNIKEGELPFERYIVYCQTNIEKPLYLRREEGIKYDLQPIVSCSTIFKAPENNKSLRHAGFKTGQVDRQYKEKRLEVSILDRRWPRPSDLHLDLSQYEAFKSALTKEFVLIQGPPGTGKTHLGLRIAKALLHNSNYWRGVNMSEENLKQARKDQQKEEQLHPMLIVCYTNHALDQFLEGMIDFMDPANRAEWKQSVVRVGGRSNSEKIEDFTLKKRRREFRKKFIDHSKFQKELQQKVKEMCHHKSLIESARKNILDETVLKPVVNEVVILSRMKLPKPFKIMEWLKVTEKDLIEAAFEKYEETEETADTSKYVSLTETEELIDVETESDNAKHERMIEEDEFEMDFTFKDIGVSVETVLNEAKSDPNFTEEFIKHLDKEGLIVNDFFLKSKPMSNEEVNKRIRNVLNLSMPDRWRMYKYFEMKFCDFHSQRIAEIRAKYDAKYKDYLIEKNYVDKEILRSSMVIAMTTTGAARYQRVLNEIGPKIIIVEEAAEVLEAHIISTLSNKCEHLILIGDHKQLEPKPSVYELAEKYNLALSMFERMIENGLEFSCLMRQHRMRPEISNLVQDMYPGLENSDSVFNREHVMGIEKDVFFISHSHAEDQKGESQSSLNEFEAKYVMRLTRYLIQQGYKRQDITVLTPYAGQMFCIRDLMPKSEFLGIRISILDNYQGEENKIIILSLVRSNKEGRLGFLKKENRICVALSRAKIGLYVIGNFQMFEKHTRSSHLLRKAINKMKTTNSLCDGLPIYCKNHPSTQKTLAKSPDDFDKAPEGGCTLLCNFELECGHTCTRLCHPYDKEHLDIRCTFNCEKKCERGHICNKICHYPKHCRCRVKVKKVLDCYHTAEMACYQEPSTYKCLEVVRRTLDCGHEATMQCWIPEQQYECQIIVRRNLTCGHSEDLECHIDYERYNCMELVKRTLSKCNHEVEMKCFENENIFNCPVEVTEKRKDCEHSFTRKCYISSILFQVQNKCCEMVKKTLPCKHFVDVECNVSIKGIKCQHLVTTNFPCHHDNVMVKCRKKDSTKCSSKCGLICSMGHECSKPCHFPEKRHCDIIVEKTHPICGHVIKVKCSENIENTKCFNKVVKTLSCGHKKTTLCHIDISQVKCKELVFKMLTCGHEKEVMCHKDVSDSDIQCQENILKSLNCGHRKMMHCFVDPLSVKCNEMTEKMLPCSHQQETECWRKVDEIKCNTNVEKNLPCGHSAFALCFQSPKDIKCEENVLKQLPNCCHTMWMKCYVSPNKIKCKQQVEFIQPTCNHINQIACHVNKSLQENVKMKPPQCTSTISRIELCGHEVTNPCTNPSKNTCRKKCTVQLACGHSCTGNCQKCKGGLFHQICSENCTLNCVCGHKCTGKHCGNCKPCEDKCMSMCSHITCENVCSRPCILCEKPCDWSCPHFSCGLPCYEPCKRPRCNKKCPKILPCGHKCAGLCGEPCLKTCLQCKSDDESKHIIKTGMVQLGACEHIFPAYELDASIEAQKISILHALRCPSCHSIISYHPRYNEILKKRANLLNMIKIQIQRQNNPVVTFPMVFGDGKECRRYLTEFGTFLSATKRKLEKMNENDLRRAQFYLEIIQDRLSFDEIHSYQKVIDIYGSIEVLSWKWKTLILKLAKNDIIEGLTASETPSETSIEDGHISKTDSIQTPADIEERFCLLGQLDNVPIDIFITKQHEIKSFISEFKPLLSSQVNTRIEKADNFPKPSGYMDCHIDRWSVCENGKTT